MLGAWIWDGSWDVGLVRVGGGGVEIGNCSPETSSQQQHDSGHCGHQCGEIMAAAAAGKRGTLIYLFRQI